MVPTQTNRRFRRRINQLYHAYDNQYHMTADTNTDTNEHSRLTLQLRRRRPRRLPGNWRRHCSCPRSAPSGLRRWRWWLPRAPLRAQPRRGPVVIARSRTGCLGGRHRRVLQGKANQTKNKNSNNENIGINMY